MTAAEILVYGELQGALGDRVGVGGRFDVRYASTFGYFIGGMYGPTLTVDASIVL